MVLKKGKKKEGIFKNVNIYIFPSTGAIIWEYIFI